MEPDHMARHDGLRLIVDLALALEEDGLDAELGEAAVEVGDGADLEQAVRGPLPVGRVERRVAAADEDRRRRLVEHDEVVGDLGARVVRRAEQRRLLPQLVPCRRRVAVLGL